MGKILGPRLRATNPPPDLPPPPTCNPLSIHLPILLLHCIPEMAIFSSCITPIETKQQQKKNQYRLSLSLSIYLSFSIPFGLCNQVVAHYLEAVSICSSAPLFCCSCVLPPPDPSINCSSKKNKKNNLYLVDFVVFYGSD